MRDIKFRAWNKRLKAFAPDNCNIQIQGDDAHVSFDLFDGNFDTAVWYLDDVELMQFTGLKDKNGVEIYEGDIVVCYPDDFEISHQKVVEWTAGRAELGITGGSGGAILCKANEDIIEVIGNIHENPELLG